MNNIMPLPPLIVLAGGKSERMGRPKGLVKIGNEDFLDYQVKNYSSVGNEKVIVVLGAHKNEYELSIPWIREAKEDYTKLDTNFVKVVINDDYEKGQFSSLQAGLREFLKGEEQFVFVLPIDVPLPDEDVFYRMLTVLNVNMMAVIPEFFGKGGHPVLLGRKFAERLVKLDVDHEDSRLDMQIAKLKEGEMSRVGVADPGIHLNLNTPEKLEQFLKNRKGETNE